MNSEIIQRVGFHLPDIKNIHMTTLDPHDGMQASLKLPLGTWMENTQKAANVLSAIALAAAGFATSTGNIPLAVSMTHYTKFLNELAGKIEKLKGAAEKAGIALDVPYDDFNDPDVKLWQNVEFVENYYQAAANDNTKVADVGFFELKLDNVTFTQNGRSLQVGSEVPDLQRYFTDHFAGFGFDDFGSFGIGGPHNRMLDWYAGTIDTDLQEFFGSPIYRRITDEGLPVELSLDLAAIPGLSDYLSLPIPTYRFNENPWYLSKLDAVAGGVAARDALFNRQTIPRNSADYVFEGISSGWFFSPSGGGKELRPDIGLEGVDVNTDNTEVPKAAGTLAVPGVFNGDFEHGNRQSILRHKAVGGGLLPGDTGRFPLSYDLPGWSFHGGSGFELGSFLDGLPWVDPIDITGLFTVETNITTVVKQILVKAWEKVADDVITRIKDSHTQRPPKPADVKDSDFQPNGQFHNKTFLTPGGSPENVTDAMSYTIWHNSYWQDGTDNAIRANNADTWVGVLDSLIDASVKRIIGDWPVGVDGTQTVSSLSQLIQIGGTTPTSLNGIKGYVSKAIETLIDKIFPNEKSDHALIMGAGSLLKDVIESVLPSLETPFGNLEGLSSALDYLVQFDRITHNRMYFPPDRPKLSFDVFLPLALTAGGGIDVTFEVAGQDAVTFETTFQPAAFSWQTLSVPVPEGFQGKVGTLTLSHRAMEDNATIAAIHDTLNIPENPNAAIRQVVLLDDIRFVNQIREVQRDGFADLGGLSEGEQFMLTVDVDVTNDSIPGVLKIDWGDKGLVDTIDLMGGGEQTYRITHTYGDNQQYPLTLKIEDGTPETYNTSIDVNANKSPTITTLAEVTGVSDSNTLIAGQGEIKLANVQFVDPGFDDSFAFIVNWGDGEISTFDIPSQNLPGVTYTAPTASHTYADDAKSANGSDEYTITYAIRDKDFKGAQDLLDAFGATDPNGQDSRSFKIQVENAVPQITPELPSATAIAGERFEFSTQFTDDEWGDDESWEYSVDWLSDSNPGSLVFTGNSTDSSGGSRKIHVIPGELGRKTVATFDEAVIYREPGVYQVKVTVRDDDGGEDTQTFSVNVLPSAEPSPALAAIRAAGRSLNADATEVVQVVGPFPALPSNISNGDFETPLADSRWDPRGNVTVVDGHGILSEAGSFAAELSQTMSVPHDAKQLQFTLVSAQLQQSGLNPGDVFEVALLDSNSFAPLVGPIAELTLTDAVINVQHDGTVFFGESASSGALAQSGQAVDLTVPRIFTIDVSDLPSGTEATLYFDLIGFGVSDSLVIIDDVKFVTGPVAPTLSLQLAGISDSGMLGDQLTNATSIAVVGQTEPNQAVLLDIDGDGFDYGSTVADASGDYRFADIEIMEGPNEIRTQATNDVGVTERSLTVVLDARPPFAELMTPNPNSTMTQDLGYVELFWSDLGAAGLEQASIDRSDLVIPGVSVDRVERVGDNRFRYWYAEDGEQLSDGDVTITTDTEAVSDIAGNNSQQQTFSFTLMREPTGALFFGPEPYFSVEDTPGDFFVPGCSTCSVHLEDFEDAILDPAIQISSGQIIGPNFSSGIPFVTDSVDADDGTIDGTGQSADGGHSWYAIGNTIQISFTASVSAAGLVWTDGDTRLRNVIFEAFDQNGASLGTIDAGDLSDDSYQGTTGEDRFFGIRYGDGRAQGISSIHLHNIGGAGIEIDHIQYVHNGMMGDLNRDGSRDALDLDLLAQAIRENQMNLTFDLNGDHQVDALDHAFLAEDLIGTRYGDTDLDGDVDFVDFQMLSSRFGQKGGWRDGNFGLNDSVNIDDFFMLSSNFGAARDDARGHARGG